MTDAERVAALETEIGETVDEIRWLREDCARVRRERLNLTSTFTTALNTLMV
jgi:hypothetical protein